MRSVYVWYDNEQTFWLVDHLAVFTAPSPRLPRRTAGAVVAGPAVLLTTYNLAFGDAIVRS